jgi:hypothetical protein
VQQLPRQRMRRHRLMWAAGEQLGNGRWLADMLPRILKKITSIAGKEGYCAIPGLVERQITEPSAMI